MLMAAAQMQSLFVIFKNMEGQQHVATNLNALFTAHNPKGPRQLEQRCS